MEKLQQSRYNVAEYDSEEERSRDPDGPPQENQTTAAAYIARRIQSVSGVYALMGGFALVLMGSRRSTRDVDMVTNLTMAQIWSLIEGDPRYMGIQLSLEKLTEYVFRLIVPNTRLTADVIKIFVKTGPGYDGCKLRKDVEVDIALPGKSHPLNLDRGFGRDLQDIIFLLEAYGDQVKEGRQFLDSDNVKAFLQSEEIEEDRKEHFRRILGTVSK
nr:hypothetical protein CFP56_57829 [Quercus suber]